MKTTEDPYVISLAKNEAVTQAQIRTDAPGQEPPKDPSTEDLLREMERYAPILAHIEEHHPAVWAEAAAPHGIATGNGYRAALAAAKGENVEAA